MTLEIWNKFNRPPATALKPIAAGRLVGKSDINPQWRLQAMTEQFGPCGVGWKYTIDRLWTEAATEGEVFAFAQVSVYIRTAPDAPWSDPIPGIGGNFLIEKERKGLHNNDEAFKMATTDALSVAMKALGVASEVYLGNWDGSKYRNRAPDDTAPEKPPAGKAAFGNGNPPPAKPFNLKTATSAEKRDRACARIAEIALMADPIAAIEKKLKEIPGKMAGMNLDQADTAAVAAALLKAEQDINAECSGQ